VLVVLLLDFVELAFVVEVVDGDVDGAVDELEQAS
jgi:hypothetical protein